MGSVSQPLSKALKRSDGINGGRRAYDPVLMFKVLVLQALYSLSDDQAEFQIQDRLPSCGSCAVDWAIKCRTPRLSGCFANTSRAGRRH
ncbi:transposase [Brucella sp. 22210]|uniref:transposase n=1 Tax=Brucella sp. 22210 TaxID=3453892 RepID=UPI003F86DFDE